MSPSTGLFQAQMHPHLKGDDECGDRILSMNEKNYDGVDVEELLENLKDSDSLHEQADIIHYLYTTR